MRHLVCREGVDLSLQVLADGRILEDILTFVEISPSFRALSADFLAKLNLNS
jgi:hypothetical protein